MRSGIKLSVSKHSEKPNLNLIRFSRIFKEDFWDILRHETVSSDHEEKLPAASLPSGRCPERGAACFQGLCPVAMANAVNGTTTPTSQLQFAPSFRSVPKGSLGPRARPSGQIMGGERRGQLGAKERRLQEWIRQPALRPPCPLPPACWVNFEMGAHTVAREARFPSKPPTNTGAGLDF